MPLFSPSEFDLRAFTEAVRKGAQSEERTVSAAAVASRFFGADNAVIWPEHLPGFTANEREFYDDVRTFAGVFPASQDAGVHLGGDHD